MLLSFLDKLGSFLDRRFILAYWLPSFVFVSLMTGLGMVIHGVTGSLKWWDNLSAAATLVSSAALLFLITILAFLLQPFTFSLTRIYLGYWSTRLRYFTNWGKDRERGRGVWTEFQVSNDRLRPTYLGNVLASAYEYPHRVYQMDPAIWLPRLAPLLPEAFRAQMDNALIPVFCLLNLSSFFSTFAVVGGLLVALMDQRWWFFFIVWVGGLTLAFTCYLASVRQAAEYGTFIRVAFDLYRHELIKRLRLPLPGTPEKEFALWARLGDWFDFTDELPKYPWKDLVKPDEPLRYENYKEPVIDATDTLNLSVGGPIELKIRLEGDN